MRNYCHFLDIGMYIHSWDFSTRQIVEKNLLNSFLLSWDGVLDCTALADKFQRVLHQFYLKICRLIPPIKNTK